jgi:hypothetical protein
VSKNRKPQAKNNNGNSESEIGESMKQETRLNRLLKEAGKLEKSVKQLLREIEDYDLGRILKKIDAELMDVQHNLVLAKSLAEGTAPKRKKKAK